MMYTYMNRNLIRHNSYICRIHTRYNNNQVTGLHSSDNTPYLYKSVLFYAGK